ncbi:hypothetical protein Syun_025260 [Stephania yunnanensis]|uniref:Uncharacterized protein n=1 Tax=Stephania yunnanensis TaxID=152371 RepID=A0AAP0ERB9_9MAGN
MENYGNKKNVDIDRHGAVAVMERCGSKGARQLGNYLDHKGNGVLLGLWINVLGTGVPIGYVTARWLVYKAKGSKLGEA